MGIGDLIVAARRRAGLSQRGLAERAGTSAAAVCLYERGERVPRVDTVDRLLRAAGEELVLRSRPTPTIDHRHSGRDLWEVLALADLLPREHRARLDAPRFADLARSDRR